MTYKPDGYTSVAPYLIERQQIVGRSRIEADIHATRSIGQNGLILLKNSSLIACRIANSISSWAWEIKR